MQYLFWKSVFRELQPDSWNMGYSHMITSLKLWITDVCLGALTTDKLWLLPSTSTHYYSECSKVARVGYAAVYNREKCLFLKLTLNCVVSLLAGASFCLVLLESDWLSRVGWWSCALASSLSPLHWRTSSSCWNDEVYLEKKKKKALHGAVEDSAICLKLCRLPGIRLCSQLLMPRLT